MTVALLSEDQKKLTGQSYLLIVPDILAGVVRFVTVDNFFRIKPCLRWYDKRLTMTVDPCTDLETDAETCT